MKSFALLTSTFSALASSLAVESRQDAAPYHYIPVDYDYGAAERVTANLTFGTAPDAAPFQVVMDTGSANLWVWAPGAIVNYGSQYLGATGPCNVVVPTEYDLYNSSTAIITNHTSTYAYGGNGKILSGQQYANDTLTPEGGNGAIPNVQSALETYGLIKIYNDGTCTGVSYDKGILGLSPFVNTTVGPSFRENLYLAGQIASKTMVIWFNKPSSILSKFTGGTLFGAIDTSKFTGPLVRVTNWGKDSQISVHYLPKPIFTIGGVSFNTSVDTSCIADTGTSSDSLPFPYEGDEAEAFYNASGNQLMDYEGVVAYNGSCDAIPANLTIGLTFSGIDAGESITIDVPIQNYARGAPVFNSSDAGKVCPLNMEMSSSDCLFGATFFTAAFFAHDDNDNSIFLARGGVSEEGSGLNTDTLKTIGAGQSFDTV